METTRAVGIRSEGERRIVPARAPERNRTRPREHIDLVSSAEPSRHRAMPSPDLPDVRDQYEALPYPARDPDDERTRLITTWLDDLPMVNHYGFAGRQSFAGGFRALVAGGGTGDATIFLAQQLRDTDAQVVHLDFSRASTAIARKRAEIRGLANIRWVEDSILNLPSLGLGRFDYINCVGVLHHLADPDEGLRALLECLKDDGALGLMVYGTVGRTAVYQMQSLLRLVNGDEPDAKARIENAKQVLSGLPRTSWFRRGEDLYEDHRHSDAGIYDLLLHSQDRSYTVGELFDWLEGGHGLHLEFTDVQCGRSSYLPHLQMGAHPPRILAKIRAMPRRRQYEIAELLNGRIQTHVFYAVRGASRAAKYGDSDCVPFLFHEPVTGAQLAEIFSKSRGQPFPLDHQWSGVSVTVRPGRATPSILRKIDGRLSFGEIFALVRKESAFRDAPPDDAALFEDFREAYEVLNAVDRLLLRHKGVQAP
jgi:SAM-dependent methyltransferase